MTLAEIPDGPDVLATDGGDRREACARAARTGARHDRPLRAVPPLDQRRPHASALLVANPPNIVRPGCGNGREAAASRDAWRLHRVPAGSVPVERQGRPGRRLAHEVTDVAERPAIVWPGECDLVEARVAVRAVRSLRARPVLAVRGVGDERRLG